MQSVLHLDDSTITALLAPRPEQVEDTVRDAFAAWGRGDAATTPRVRATSFAPATDSNTTDRNTTGRHGATPTITGMASAMAAVVVPYCGGKLYATANGRFRFVNVLFHVDGRLLAVLDGDAITGFRTAAASKLAIELLAPPTPTVATVVGTGRQSWPHATMLATTLPSLTELRICGLAGDPAVAELAARVGDELGLRSSTFDDPAAAVTGAQVVVTITNSATPLFPASAVGDDTLICAVGATKYDRAEIGPDVVARCTTVVCDDVAGSQIECGDLIQAAAAGAFDWARAVELHDLAAGNLTATPAGVAGPVLFETQGVAIQDVALSALAYELHQQRTTAATAPAAAAG